MKALPTLRQMQFLLALAKRKSFSQAAEDCLISQSTLSSAIKELEKLLQCQLVDRSTRTFALTAAGTDTVQRAAQIVALSEDLTRAVVNRSPLAGPFRLGVIPTVAPFLLPRATRKLNKAYPDLKLFLREDLSANLIDQLSNGALDAVLLAFPYDIPGADYIEIGEDAFWVAVPADHSLASQKSVALKDLRKTNLLLLEDGHCLREHAIDACGIRSEAADTFGATSLYTLAEMVRSGLGITLLPQISINTGLTKISGLKTIPLKSPVPKRMIGIAWRKGSGRAEEAAAMADVFRAQF